jgi:hypothetical protein
MEFIKKTESKIIEYNNNNNNRYGIIYPFVNFINSHYGQFTMDKQKWIKYKNLFENQNEYDSISYYYDNMKMEIINNHMLCTNSVQLFDYIDTNYIFIIYEMEKIDKLLFPVIKKYNKVEKKNIFEFNNNKFKIHFICEKNEMNEFYYINILFLLNSFNINDYIDILNIFK